MKRFFALRCLFLAALFLASHLPAARPAVVIDGDVHHDDVFYWNSDTDGYIGQYGEGSVEVNGGSVLESDQGYIGRYAGSLGTVTVDGVGSSWANSGSLDVGDFGSGTLHITGGATVSSYKSSLGSGPGSTGVATIEGAGSTWTNGSWLYVGAEGSGTLRVSDGGSFSGSSCYVGSGAGSTGLVTVDGAGSSWTNSHYGLYVGSGSGNGTFEITNGATVSSGHSYIGDWVESTGLVTVDGPDSTWTSGRIEVGSEGNGTLRISGGASVVVDDFYVARKEGSTGLVDFGPGGGTITARTVWFSPDQLMGSGTIEARSLGSDLDLLLDAAHPLVQTISLAPYSGEDVTIFLDMSDTSDLCDFAAGYRGNGSLTIRDGIAVASEFGYVGYQATAKGVVSVDGPGSTWTTNRDLRIGQAGVGTLNIINAGNVGSQSATLGYEAGSTGIVSVDGPDSTWDSRWLDIGGEGEGIFHIRGGGAVATTLGTSVTANSLLTIDVGRGSLLEVGAATGTMDNDGTVRIVAGLGVSLRQVYTPIAAGTWTGRGTCQAVGGVWDADTHQFTASILQSGVPGVTRSIDTARVQRLVIADDVTGWTLGAGFLAAEETSELNFTATPVDNATLGDLLPLLSGGEAVRGAWTFEIDGSGYAPGDPVYLSFAVGDSTRSDLTVWHHDGAAWTPFAASDLTCFGQYASFTATEFSSYAVTAVPEPTTLAMLLGAAMVLAVLRRRRRK